MPVVPCAIPHVMGLAPSQHRSLHTWQYLDHAGAAEAHFY